MLVSGDCSCVGKRERTSIAMSTTEANAFLPRVRDCPHVVIASAVGRALRGLYTTVLREPLPDDLADIVKRADSNS